MDIDDHDSPIFGRKQSASSHPAEPHHGHDAVAAVVRNASTSGRRASSVPPHQAEPSTFELEATLPVESPMAEFDVPRTRIMPASILSTDNMFPSIHGAFSEPPLETTTTTTTTTKASLIPSTTQTQSTTTMTTEAAEPTVADEMHGSGCDLNCLEMLAEHDQPQRPWLVDEAQREGNEAMGLIYQTPARIYRQSPSALVSLSLHSRHRLPPIFTIPKFGSRVTKSHRPATTFTSPASISSALMRHRSARLPFRGGFDDSTDILHGRIIEVDCEDEASSDSVPQDLRERRHRSGHWRYPHAMTDTAIIRQEDPLMAVRPSAHVIRGRHARIAQAIKQWMKENKPAQHAVTTMGTADLDTVFKLAKSGTSVNIKDDLGRTPLHIAATAGKVENVRFLIAMGADLNAMDNLGNTPLTLAATAAKFNIVLLLLENGADQSAGRAQFSPLEMARSRLRLMRAQLQAMRGMHDIHRPSVYSGDASLGSYSKRVHNRRQRLVQVARDCLEVIKLLQSFQQAAPQHRAIGRNGRTLNTLEQTYAAFDRNLSSEPAPLTGSAASELDELALKLLGLGIDSKPDKPPQSSPLAAGQTEVNVEDGQGEPAAGGDGQGTKGKEVDRSSDGAAETEEKKDSAELCDRFERDMDLVLSKLSQLMGESTDKDTTVVE